MKFYYPILSTMITQCASAKRLSTIIPDMPHFDYVLNFLQTNGYIRYNQLLDKFWVFPCYTADRTPVLTRFRVVTKPSNRAYVSVRKLRSMNQGYIHYIVSTRKGLMTAREAERLNIGGEIIYEIC